MRDYDLEPIVVSSLCSFEPVKQFWRFHHRSHKNVAIFAAPLALLLGIAECLNAYPDSYIALVCFMIFAYEGYRFATFNGNLYTQKHYERYKNSYRGKEVYRFMNDHYTSTGEDGAYHALKDSPYDDVVQICETQTMFYLYLTPSSAQMIGKQTLRDGGTTPEAFRAFLKEKFVGAKYEIVNFK